MGVGAFGPLGEEVLPQISDSFELDWWKGRSTPLRRLQKLQFIGAEGADQKNTKRSKVTSPPTKTESSKSPPSPRSSMTLTITIRRRSTPSARAFATSGTDSARPPSGGDSHSKTWKRFWTRSNSCTSNSPSAPHHSTTGWRAPKRTWRICSSCTRSTKSRDSSKRTNSSRQHYQKRKRKRKTLSDSCARPPKSPDSTALSWVSIPTLQSLPIRSSPPGKWSSLLFPREILHFNLNLPNSNTTIHSD